MLKKFFKYSILLFVFLNTNIAMSNNDIYFIDMEYLMNNSLAGISIIKKLDVQNRSIQKTFQETEKNLKNEETCRKKIKNCRKRESLLYEFSRGNQVDGLPRAFIRKLSQKQKDDSAEIGIFRHRILKNDEK